MGAIALPSTAAKSEGPWHVAFAKLFADRAAMLALAVLIVIVLAASAAPLYARYVAHTDPFRANITGEIDIDGVSTPVIEASTEGLGLGQTPIGPTWRGRYFLGADDQGRDVAARMFYGGRASLIVAAGSTAFCIGLGAMLGIIAGFFGGLIDAVLSRMFEILWAFPVYLFAISLSIVMISTGISLGPITINANDLILPIFIIGLVYMPYIARPVRAQVKGLRRSEFVMAAIGLGVPDLRILWRDVLPNVLPTLIVMTPLTTALNMLTESSLSFLSIGVQAPNASWGTIIQDGEGLLYTRPMVALAPGIAVAVTVLALNILGDGMRDALDPRAAIRIGAV
jgi:peptide/nickel transport system permease protein